MRRAALGWCLCGCLAAGATADDPEILAANIVNAADHSSGRVSPGEIVILYPAHAGPAALVGQHLDESGRIATAGGETRVLFDGIPAPLAYTISGEIAAVAPYEVAGRTAVEVVVEYRGRRSAPVTLPLVESTPALFTLDGSGMGQAAMLNDTGCCNSARNPAAAGSVVALYATGEGQTAPAGITGNVSSYPKPADYPAPRLPVAVTVGGKKAQIVFAGEAPHTVTGLLQVNFRIPDDVEPGDAVPLVLTVGDAHSIEGVTMAVRSAVQRVVVADADPAARAWLQRLLRGAGYQVVDALAHQAADLAIIGLSLPERQRTALLRDLQALRPRMKIAVIAPLAGAESLRAADLMGAQAVFTRPLASAVVLGRVKELLRPHPVPYVTEDIPLTQRLLSGAAH